MRIEILKSVLRRLTSGPWPVVIVTLLLLLSLYLMSSATENSATFDRRYVILLGINALGLMMMVLLIAANAWRLFQNYRRAAPGARLTVRLLSMFVLIAVIPVTVVYYFSIGFLHRGIDSWFDVRIEQALDDSLELSRTALDVRMRDLLRQSKDLAVELTPISDPGVALTLDDMRQRVGANEMTLFDGSDIVASSSAVDSAVLNPSRPDDGVVAIVREGRPSFLNPIAELTTAENFF